MTQTLPKAPTRVRRPKRQDVRAALVRVAIRVFARDGFQQASIEDIANLAGFSRGAVYSNFESKDDLFLVAFEQNADEVMGKIFSDARSMDANSPTAIFERQIQVSDVWAILLVEFCVHVARHPEYAHRLKVVRERIRHKLANHLKTQLKHAQGDFSFADLAIATLALRNGLIIEGLMMDQVKTTIIAQKIAKRLYK